MKKTQIQVVLVHRSKKLHSMLSLLCLYGLVSDKQLKLTEIQYCSKDGKKNYGEEMPAYEIGSKKMSCFVSDMENISKNKERHLPATLKKIIVKKGFMCEVLMKLKNKQDQYWYCEELAEQYAGEMMDAK